jgi:hypothetical protein
VNPVTTLSGLFCHHSIRSVPAMNPWPTTSNTISAKSY